MPCQSCAKCYCKFLRANMSVLFSIFLPVFLNEAAQLWSVKIWMFLQWDTETTVCWAHPMMRGFTLWVLLPPRPYESQLLWDFSAAMSYKAFYCLTCEVLYVALSAHTHTHTHTHGGFALSRFHKWSCFIACSSQWWWMVSYGYKCSTVQIKLLSRQQRFMLCSRFLPLYV